MRCPREAGSRFRRKKLTLAGCSPFVEARPGEFVCLNVTDTGTGIAAEHLPHLSSRFSPQKEVGKGTGLGLATVHGTSKQHQGWIGVASQVQVGFALSGYFCRLLRRIVPENVIASGNGLAAVKPKISSWWRTMPSACWPRTCSKNSATCKVAASDARPSSFGRTASANSSSC